MEWSPPVGGAPVIDYIVHYTDSDGNISTVSTNADSTSVDISGLNYFEIYTIIVEARSEHLPGESEPMNISSKFTSLSHQYMCFNKNIKHN